MANDYNGRNGNGYQPIGYDKAPVIPPTTEYRFARNWQTIPLSMVIIGAMSVGFVIGCAL